MRSTSNGRATPPRRRAGIVLSVAGIVGALVVAGAATSAQATSDHIGAQSNGVHESAAVAAHKRVVLRFIHDVLNEHHGDHAASYLAQNMQWHGGPSARSPDATT